MLHKSLIVIGLFASLVLVSGCGTQINAHTEQAAEIMYFDIEQDSTETLRQGLQNNLVLDSLGPAS